MLSDETLRRVLPAGAVALLGDVIRALGWGLVFIVWVAFAQVYARMIRLTISDPTHSDFTIFYYTSRMVADGLPMYGESPGRYGIEWVADHLGNLNPPHVQLLLLPLGYLSYRDALACFVAVNAACLAWSLWLVARELAIPWSWQRFWIWGALTISCAAFTTVAVTCELTFVLMVPFTIAWRAWRREQWTAAGAWLGACASAKLFLLLFVPLLIWQRRWKAVAAFVGTACALTALGVALFGVGVYAQWAATLGRVAWWWIPMNASWHGIVSRALEGSETVAPVVHNPSLVRHVAFVGSVVFALGSLASARLAEAAALRRDASFLVVFLGAILASPLGWVYYLPLAYGPMLGWFRSWRADAGGATRASAIAVYIGCACLYVPQELASWLQHSPIATLTLASVYFWGVVLLWTAVGRGRWVAYGR
jgi:hypothetical protein